MNESIKNILIINFGGLGDQILFLPVLSTIKNKFPNANVSFVTESRSSAIKSITNDINNVIFCDIKTKNKYIELLKLVKTARQNKYDLIISSGSSLFIPIILFLTGIQKRIGYNSSILSKFLLTNSSELKTNQYAANMYHDLVETFSDDNTDKIPEIIVNEQSVRKMTEFIPKDSLTNIIIHPGVSQMSIDKNILKFWSVDNWVNLINELLELGHRAILAGGPDDKNIVSQIKTKLGNNVSNKLFVDITDKTKSIEDLVASVELSDIAICVDSAPMHIAVGRNKKTIALFGPTNEEKLLPENKNFIPVYKENLKCRPCLWDVRQSSCENPVCLDVKVNQVIQEVNKFIKELV